MTSSFEVHPILEVVEPDAVSPRVGEVEPGTPEQREEFDAHVGADGKVEPQDWMPETYRKTLVDYSPEDGPDGLICDADGNLYVAVRDETRSGSCRRGYGSRE